MDNRILLERKLSNRMTRQDLISRGIISESQAGVFVASNLSQLNRIQKGNFINSRISQRPSREDLARLRILNVGLDSDEAALVREKLNDHLKTRPGPLEVFDYLVYSTSDGHPRSVRCHPLNIQKTQNNTYPIQNNFDNVGYFIVSPTDGTLINVEYGDPLSVQLCEDPFTEASKLGSNGLYSNGVEYMDDGVQRTRRNPANYSKPNIAKNQQSTVSHKKFTNYNFHEYKPQATATGNRVIKCTDTRSSPYSNHHECGDHYRTLIEQQARFLQYEVANRCSGGIQQHSQPQFLDAKNNVFFEGNQYDYQPQSYSFNMINKPPGIINTPNDICHKIRAATLSPSIHQSGGQSLDPYLRDISSVSSVPEFCINQASPLARNNNKEYSIPQYLSENPSSFDSRVTGLRVSQQRTGSLESCQNGNRKILDSNSNILASLMDDENIISDVRSSDYMNSLYSDLSEFEQPYIGFGGILDFDDFPSISEKVALYEQLSTNVP